MTPADHYREADRLLASGPAHPEIIAKAQAHATLALAGATALERLVGHDDLRGDLGDALLGREPLQGRQPWERTIGRPPETMAENAARRAREAGR